MNRMQVMRLATAIGAAENKAFGDWSITATRKLKGS